MQIKTSPSSTRAFLGVFPWKMSPEVLAFGLSIYFSFFLNDILWNDLLKTQTGTATSRWAFFWAVYIAVTALQFFIINLMLWGRFSKWSAIVLVAVTVLADYYAETYSVHFDTTMLRNIFTTNPAEAKELLTTSLLFHFLKYASLPILAIFFLKMKPNRFIRSLTKKLIISVIVLLVAVGSLLSQFKNFSSTMRNHKEIRHVVLPTSFLFSSAKIAFQSTAEVNKKIRPIGDDATRNQVSKSNKPEILVIVVGETVRAANWGLSGYDRNTTPLLAEQKVYSFPYATSCGTNTDTSVPCMFSQEGRHNYDEKSIRSSESLLHVVNKVGFGVTWIDNQSGCKGVCAGLSFYDAKTHARPQNCFDTACFDNALLDSLEWQIQHNAGNQVIILHQLGNHGPAYHARYPKEFEKYSPACNTSDLSQCSQQEIVNAYDNSIRYTDAFLSKTIDQLKKHKNISTSLIYMSDHGESLGENGIYLHGLPYSIAPKQQTQVPFFVWLSDNYKIDHPKLEDCFAEESKKPAHHDNLFHTVLGMFDIKTSIYERKFDLTERCHG
ncbi:MAG: Phosphoethanolamine transferase EptA [Pseudomonadota bacterium]|jgi:lipid A ethanolaminephosphotransferase